MEIAKKHFWNNFFFFFHYQANIKIRTFITINNNTRNNKGFQLDRKTKPKNILIMPKLHSKFNDTEVEQALLEKSRTLLGKDVQDLSFILLSGQFFDTRGYAYSAIRDWRGATRPSDSQRRQPKLDALFACLSVYLSSLIAFNADFNFAFEEIKKILVEKERDDLWTIIEEKLPFVSLPPQEMFPPGLKSPISPYYVIQQDSELTLGEIYPSVYLSNVVKDLKPRFFCFFSFEGSTCFGYFNSLPTSANFGFDEAPKMFTDEVNTENLVNYIDQATNLKDLFVALIQCHNNSLLEQYLIEDYETFLNSILEIKEVEEQEN